MSNEVDTAVTSVVPANKAPRGNSKAAAASEAKPSRTGRGRTPIILKGGKPYAEARDEAKDAMRDAKQVLRDAKLASKEATKVAKAAEKTLAGLEKDLERAVAKPDADKAVQRDRVRAIKDDIKDAKAAAREATKEAKAGEKAVATAEKGVEKAQAAIVKVEQQKAQALN